MTVSISLPPPPSHTCRKFNVLRKINDHYQVSQMRCTFSITFLHHSLISWHITSNYQG
uniref:Uncharacterized protein n=1 Tax=Rhizophora mucronata TaxID=61149 RepID=A0A2P2PXK6_RHIMU